MLQDQGSAARRAGRGSGFAEQVTRNGSATRVADFRNQDFRADIGLASFRRGEPDDRAVVTSTGHSIFKNDYYLRKVYNCRGESCRTLALISQSGLAKSPYRGFLPPAYLAGVGYRSAPAFSLG